MEKNGNLSFFQLSLLASNSRGWWCAICVFPSAAVYLFVDWRLHSVSYLCIPYFCPIFRLHFSSSLFVFQHFLALLSLCLLCLPLFCTSDGLSQLQPWLYFWRSVQQLSETLSEGRSQQKACLLLNCASPSALLKHIFAKTFPTYFAILLLFSLVLQYMLYLLASMRLIKSFKDSTDEGTVLPNLWKQCDHFFSLKIKVLNEKFKPEPN